MYDHHEGVIEIGSDGAFDLSSKSVPKPLSPLPKEVKPPAVQKEEKELSDWEIKKQRGNSAYASGNLELAIDCYTAALKHIESSTQEEEGVKRVAKVSILANRALCYMKRAEESEAVTNGFADAPAWSPSDSGANTSEDARTLWRLCEKDCEEALTVDPGHAKALYRNSRAKHALGNHMHAFSAARNAKRIAPKAKEIVSWEAWLRALEAEREATMAATASAEKAFTRGDGGQDASGVAEQACLEAAAAYLHVLGTTATHTNQANPIAVKKSNMGAQGVAHRHYQRGPRDATEGALFAATRAVALAMHTREPQNQSEKMDYLAKMCQDVAMGAARVAGGGLSGLLAVNDPRRDLGSRRGTEDDESTPQGSGMRAARATLSALLLPLTSGQTQKDGLVSKNAAVQAAGAAAFFTAVTKGVTANTASTVTTKCLVEAAGIDVRMAQSIASSLSQGTAVAPSEGGTPRLDFIASDKFSGAKLGYVFRSGAKGLGYYLDQPGALTPGVESSAGSDSSGIEEEALATLLTALPNEEARESVKKLLKMSKSELKKLPLELQDHVAQLKDMYKQHVDFAKQSKSAEKHRTEQATTEGVRPTHNPRDGPVPPKDMTLEEKLAKRRADELKWLEEYSEKEAKRRQEQEESGKSVVDRAQWEKQEEERRLKEAQLRAEEEKKRRDAALSHINELKISENSPQNHQLHQASSSATMDKTTEKKRKNKQKKQLKKERSGQFDDIRKLAASASLMSSFDKF